jgi:uncharacterized repeat protein (TIGR01451 family)
MCAVRRGSYLLVLTLFCSQVHADADLSVSKSVTPETPAAGQPVEFTVTVGNAGPDAAADVHVTELLPDGLSIPTGTAAFVSQGAYDAATGDWALGDLAMGGGAVMTLPARVDVDPQPPCLVNEAAIEPNSNDPGRTRETSAAAVRNGAERCVDLAVPDTLFEVPQPFCSDTTTARLSFNVYNHGPHEARNVVVTVAQSPATIPGFHFTSSNCTSGSLRCELGSIAPGSLRIVDLVSDSFHNAAAYTVQLSITTTTSDVDYDPANNDRSRPARVPRTVTPQCDVPGGTIGGGCFIATAAWGEPWDDNVRTLRRFRDRFLVGNAPGEAFVRWYYRVSPPVAAFVAQSPARRAVVRAALTPLVVGIRHPAGALLVVGGIPAAWAFRRRRRNQSLG